MKTCNYIKGRAKEYRIKKKFESRGMICTRAAGSHSPFDLICVDRKEGVIHFIQCKPKKFSKREKERLEEQYKWLKKYIWYAEFSVI